MTMNQLHYLHRCQLLIARWWLPATLLIAYTGAFAYLGYTVATE